MKKAYIFLGFFLIYMGIIHGQNQQLADSLELLYSQGNFEEHNRLKILEQLAINQLDPEKKLSRSDELIRLALEMDSTSYLWSGYIQKGTAYKVKANYDKSLENYFHAAEYANNEHLYKKIGAINITIADVYSLMGNHHNAVEYYQKSINILRKENDSITLAISLLNTGEHYLQQQIPDIAMVYFRESGQIFKNIDHKMGIAYNLGNMGMVYFQKGENELSEDNLKGAIEILNELGDYSPICEYLIVISQIYQNRKDIKDIKESINYANRSLQLSQQYGLKKHISDANLKLSELYEQEGIILESFEYYKNHIIYRDSVNNIETVQEIADLRTDFEVQKKQDEIVFLEKEAEISELRSRKQKNMTYASAITSVLVLLLAFTLFRRYNYIKKTSYIIQQETIKSEKLLLNILPEETALELKLNGKVQAKQFDSVSVMFTDFKDFTKHSLNLTPEVIVKSVDFYFSKFDEIIEKYELEKIKTIGDAYMCAGGLPFPNKNHSRQMIEAAFEILEFVQESKKITNKNIANFDVRIGINTGPVVAGVVGVKKFAYDIWGDTVNVASRMESMSTPGRINVSENTYELIKDTFDCEYRGEIEVKNKGLMKMYFVNGIKT